MSRSDLLPDAAVFTYADCRAPVSRADRRLKQALGHLDPRLNCPAVIALQFFKVRTEPPVSLVVVALPVIQPPQLPLEHFIGRDSELSRPIGEVEIPP